MVRITDFQSVGSGSTPLWDAYGVVRNLAKRPDLESGDFVGSTPSNTTV